MTRTDLSKREAIEKYSNQGLYLMTINIWYDGIKVSEDEDYLWGIFGKQQLIWQYAKQQWAALCSSTNIEFDEEVYGETVISTLSNSDAIPAHSTWKFIDKENLKPCTYKVDIQEI